METVTFLHQLQIQDIAIVDFYLDGGSHEKNVSCDLRCDARLGPRWLWLGRQGSDYRQG